VNDSTDNSGNTRPKRKWLFPLGVAAIAISSIVVVSCFHDDDPAVVASNTPVPLPDEPVLQVQGDKLYCDAVAPISDTASGLYPEAPDSIAKHNVSHDLNTGDVTNPASWNNHNAGNVVQRMAAIVTGQKPDGTVATDPVTLDPIGDVHPLLVSYGEQVIGDYELGDGSADVGDPYNIDDIFVSLSLDNGTSWNKVKVGDTANSSSIFVRWADSPDGRLLYPGHSHKPTMAVQNDQILVAWNDKYCPSGDPFDLVDEEGNLIDPEQPDTYKVNGSQGSIDYGGIVALPNGKTVDEVPFSCVWTARGVLTTDTDLDGDGEPDVAIQWRQAKQMTSGTRDSNKIWIAPAKDIGFAITWQEDPDGLRTGKGLGPGAGWSGASTNHGTDIWYTFIRAADFDDVCALSVADDPDCASILTEPTATQIADLGEKPKAAVNYAYPVRITNNEVCSDTDANADTTTKLWCVDNCVSTIAVTSQSGNTTNRCVQNDIDYMVADSTISPQLAVLDGDTGASRPALKLLRTNATTLDADGDPEVVAVLVYEETKGLAESSPGDQDQGTSDTDIAVEGKSVYFESFFWKEPVTVSAGRIVNTFVPEVVVNSEADGDYTDTGLEIYENARRVVFMPQVDPCEQQAGDPTFAILYKQGIDTQGGPSDMFVRVNYGFTFDEFGLLDGREVTNVSSHTNEDVLAGRGQVIWDQTWLDTQSYEVSVDNTFSPRGWLRGGEVYTGFEYSPLWRATSVGTIPNNFWMHSFVDSAWQGPKQLSIVTGAQVSTLDPRFIPTPKGKATTIASDASNPDVLFLGYGTFNMETGHELDLLYMRSTDKGVNWEYLDDSGNIVLVNSNPATSDGIPGTDDDAAKRVSKLAAMQDVVEMELQGAASPDGTMYFGVWNEESDGPVTEGDASRYGLESRAGLVVYDDPDPAAPVQ
jgi:hypothetical protein